MTKYYRKLAQQQPDKKKREAYQLKAQQLEDGRELNYAFLEYVGYKEGDEKISAATAILKKLFG